MKNIRDFIGEDEHDERMKAAKKRAEWELGDASWARVLIGAYLHPIEDTEALNRETGGEVT